MLAQSTSSATPSPSPEVDVSELDDGSTSRTKLAFIVTGSGIILIGLSAGFYFFYRRIEQNGSEDEKEDSDTNL